MVVGGCKRNGARGGEVVVACCAQPMLFFSLGSWRLVSDPPEASMGFWWGRGMCCDGDAEGDGYRNNRI